MLKLFTRDTCSPCKALKRHLDVLNVKYEELPADTELHRSYALKFGGSVPLLIKDEEGMTGYYPTRLKSFLGI
jgi:glutaredoxin